MTLDDLITFLVEEARDQTLVPSDIERCILLAHDLGMAPKTPEEHQALMNLRVRVSRPRILQGETND